MEPEQDWCLNCGTAAPGRLGERPGWRAASTVIALALLLVLGAVGAGYAALTGDSQPTQTASAARRSAARGGADRAPGRDHAAAGRHHPAPGGDVDHARQAQDASEGQDADGRRHGGGADHAAHADDLDTRHQHGHGDGHWDRHHTPGRPATGTGTGTGTGTTTTPAAKPIELNGDAGTVYDPFKRVKESGETTRALDDDQTTSWYVDPTVPTQIAVGYVVDLGKLQGVRQIELQTPTPGFRVEIYATDETTPPPDILDTRWSHIKNVSNVGAKNDGKQKIVLGAGTSKYRNVLLWFTQPPTDGPRLRITELKLLG